MYSIVDGKNRFTYPYSVTMNIIYDKNNFGVIEPPYTMKNNKFNTPRIVFKHLLQNKNNRYRTKLIKEKELLDTKNQRNKIELMINYAYDKKKNNIRNYSYNPNLNHSSKVEKLPLLTKEKIKNEIISRSNKYFPKEYRNKNRQIYVRNIYQKFAKLPNYKRLYKIKYIEKENELEDKVIDKKFKNINYIPIDLNLVKPILNNIKKY